MGANKQLRVICSWLQTAHHGDEEGEMAFDILILALFPLGQLSVDAAMTRPKSLSSMLTREAAPWWRDSCGHE
jgi:hypothetical protein